MIIAQAKHLARDIPGSVVYVGRNLGVGKCYQHHARSLANPFKIEVGRTRERAVEEYRQWLWERIQDPQSPQSQALARLLAMTRKYAVVTLVCHCNVADGELCHSTVIAAALKWLDERTPMT